MKIIDAIWDKKNLGMNAVEISIEPGDTADLLRCSLDKLAGSEPAYQVAKVPADLPEFNRELGGLGFSFAECQLTMKINKEQFAYVENRWEDYMEAVQFRRVTRENSEELLSQFEAGIFKTDRIALEPRFGIGIANLRYKNWVWDCMERPEYLVEETLIDGVPIGFGLFKLEGPKISGLLGGAYLNAAGSGYYVNGMYRTLQKNFSLGYKRFEGKVSSNNPPIVTVYECLGASISEIKYVFARIVGC